MKYDIINNTKQIKDLETYKKLNVDVPISLARWTKGLRRRPTHRSEQDEDTKAPLSSKELEDERRYHKKGKAIQRTPTLKKQEWHSRPNPSQDNNSPRSQKLETELQHANDALIQLKEQVDQTRKKRLSKSPSQMLHTPRMRQNVKNHHGMNGREDNVNHQKASHGLGLDFGQLESPLHDKIEEARAHARHHEGRPIAVKAQRKKDCDQPKQTSLPLVKSQNQWAVFASTASPILPSSTQSTPQIKSTPTLQSSSWSESPIIASAGTFSSTSTQNPPHYDSTAKETSAPPPPPPSTSSFSSSEQNNAQHQAQKGNNDVVLASALAGSLTGAVLLALLALWAILSCKKKRKRRQELNTVLDKVAPPRSPFTNSAQGSINLAEKDMDVESHDYNLHKDNPSGETNQRDPEIRIVPSLDLPQLYPSAAANLEAFQRHSHELARSGIIAEGVRSDASFTWKFPKLSVPPAAARAIQSGHYVKKRLTMPTERSFKSFNDQSFISDTKEGNRSANQSQKKEIEAISISESTISTSFLFAHHGSTNASSENIDPQIDHQKKEFVEDKKGKETQINNAKKFGDGSIGIKASSSSLPSSIGIRRWFQSEQKREQIITKGENIENARKSIVLLAHDPMMQDVMRKVLSMTEEMNSIESHQSSIQVIPKEVGHRITMEADQSSILTSAIPDDAKEDWRYANRALNGTSLSSMQELTPLPRTSWAGSALDTCREDSQESDQISRDLRSASGNKSDTRKSCLANQAVPHDHEDQTFSHPRSASDQITADYSAHSIVIHSVDEEMEDRSQEFDDSESSSDHSIPITPDLRICSSASTLGAPKIMLTSTEEDGKHERQISVTSIETSKTSTSKASSTTESQDGFFDINSAIIFSDMAIAIGQAYEQKLQHSVEGVKQQDIKEIHLRNTNRDSESTLDSLVAYSRERRETLIMQTSQESLESQPFNETFSRAASRVGFDDDQLIETQRSSITPSETGTVCLIDDDFPTIPSWKSMLNSSKQTELHLHIPQEQISTANYF